MMGGANFAAQSDPVHNVQFRRLWLPPPHNEKRRPPAGTAYQEIKINDTITFIKAEAAAQRACAAAARRAKRLTARSVALAQIGQQDAAGRLAALASELAEVAQ